MSKKILYMQDPVISTYTSYGSLFSIIDDKIWPWVFNNFIQIRYTHNWNIYVFDNHIALLNSCPNIAYYEFPQSMIISKWNKSLKDLIIDSVNSDFYLFLYADRYYISKSSSYLNDHFPHEIFIFGYDLEKNLVYIADNLQGGKFIRTECTFEEIENGYWNIDTGYAFMADVRLLKPKGDTVCDLDLEQIHFGLDSYLNSKRTVDLLYYQKCDFGYNAINRLFGEMEFQLKSIYDIDLRPFHLLYEHKLLMEMRVKYMVQHGYITDNCNLVARFSDVKNNFLFLRNMAIKRNILKSDTSRNSLITDTILKKLQLNIMTEKNLIIDLIQTISNQLYN